MDGNNDGNQGRDDQGGRDEQNERHASGSISLEGFAQEWFRQRQTGLARLAERPYERQAYERAMDRLFLNAERVIL